MMFSQHLQWQAFAGNGLACAIQEQALRRQWPH